MLHVSFRSNSFLSNTRLWFNLKKYNSQISKEAKRKINIINKTGRVGFVIATKIAAFITNEKQCLPPPLPLRSMDNPLFWLPSPFLQDNFQPPSDFSKILTPFLNKGGGGLHYDAGII